MTAFYRIRLGKHQKKMLRYLKYVLNDHFMLVSMFGIGGLGFYYSEFIKGLEEDLFLVKPIVIVIWLTLLAIGKLATLLLEADKVFLLPKEHQMRDYLSSSLKHSLLIPFVVIALLSGMTMPVLVATSKSIAFTDFFYFALILWGLKYAQLLLQLMTLFLDGEKSRKITGVVWFVGSLISLIVALYFHPLLGGIPMILTLWYVKKASRRLASEKRLDWEKAIRIENKRMKKMYSFFNLFTDVPGLSGTVKRRRYLDGVLNLVKKVPGNTFYYLYTRVFLRGTEYSGLVLRLSVIGGLILGFTEQLWLGVLVGCLFLYLIGFQLIPIYSEFDYMLMANLYPLDKKQKGQAVERLVSVLLLLVITLFMVIILGTHGNLIEGALMVGAFLVEWFIFTKLYLTNRIKKMEKNRF